MKHLFYFAFLFLMPVCSRAKDNVELIPANAAVVPNQYQYCREAENENGNGPITSDPNASNGGTRGDEHYYDHYVDYVVNAVQVTGTHQMTLRYYASGDPQVSITVNGNVVIPFLTLPASHSWNIVSREETIDLSLNAGTNVIRVQCLPGYSIRQDKICVTGPAKEPAVCDFNVSPLANPAVYAPQTTMNFYAYCRGDNCDDAIFNWSGNGQTATGRTVSLLSPAQNGSYVYTVTALKEGCPIQTGTVAIQVDESLPRCDFSVSATASNNAPGCSTPVSLSAGCTGAVCDQVSYQWSGLGVAQAGQAIDITAPAGKGLYLYTVTASKDGCPPVAASVALNIKTCDQPTGSDFNICLEAEEENGNGPVTSDPNASNGGTRGEQNNYDHYVDYRVNGVKSTGDHLVKVRYYASGAAQASISVNGNVAIPSANFPATNSWNIVWREETFYVPLNQGDNVLRIQGLPGSSIRQDKICVSASGQPVCDFIIAPTSNQPVYDVNKPTTMTLKANCAGGDCEGVTYTWTGNGINASGENVSFTSPSLYGAYVYYVTASKPGCADKTASVMIRVDYGVAPCRFGVYPRLVTSEPACSTPAVMWAQCPEYDCDNVTYTWKGPGLDQATGQAVNFTTPSETGSYAYSVTASKPGCESKTVDFTINIKSCTPPVSEDFGLCLESETQDGSAPVTSDPNASGGGTRGDENNYRHYVNYAVSGVPVDGSYRLTLRYAARSNPQVSISVNGSYVLNATTVPATNSWNIVFGEQDFTIPLKAGNNIVRIEGAPGASIRQDKICIASPHSNARMSVPEQQEQSIGQKDVLAVFPNPAPGEFSASFALPENEAKITITDMRGRVWHDVKVKGKGPHDEKIKLAGAPAGIYIMQVKFGKTTKNKKVLIVR
ncbi:T9SS type A sorting domain-containing protein [Dyadobacter jiangsuensis]